jgi:hypothetical protein
LVTTLRRVWLRTRTGFTVLVALLLACQPAIASRVVIPVGPVTSQGAPASEETQNEEQTKAKAVTQRRRLPDIPPRVKLAVPTTSSHPLPSARPLPDACVPSSIALGFPLRC